MEDHAGPQEDLAALTVQLLKARCRELNLTVKGRKADLIARIMLATKSDNDAPISSWSVDQHPHTLSTAVQARLASPSVHSATAGLPVSRSQNIAKPSSPNTPAFTAAHKHYVESPRTSISTKSPKCGQLPQSSQRAVSEDARPSGIKFPRSPLSSFRNPRMLPLAPAPSSVSQEKKPQALTLSTPAPSFWVSAPPTFNRDQFLEISAASIRELSKDILLSLWIVFAHLSAAELAVAQQVSKQWYIAGVSHWRRLLISDFPGRRTVKFLSDKKNHDFPGVTQAYHQFRSKFYVSSRQAHLESWIGKLHLALSGASTVSNHGIQDDIFKATDHEQQPFVARRFWITLFVRETRAQRQQVLTDNIPSVRAVELLCPDIARVWSDPAAVPNDIRFANSACYLVITHTGEILTSLSDDSEVPPAWTWVAQKLEARQPSGTALSSLSTLIPTLNGDFPFNMHPSLFASGAHWKHVVGSRFVLAHCDGLDASLASGFARQATHLPALPHDVCAAVQSVHAPTHPCAEVFIVQTLAYGALFVLETGHTIGTEDDEINPMWQRLLHCDGEGRLACPLASPSRNYFQSCQIEEICL
ncbi:hypothetical protein HKX48_005294 [Thoreauomyces humboldtii]|nr:hypothetical protein HKX48_005294 [Thoreauomyces humboldtii]